MEPQNTAPALQQRINARADALLQQSERANAERIDRLFALLLVVEWVAAVIVALCFSPRAWEGLDSYIHPHVWAAIFLGAVIASLPVLLALTHPGTRRTRYVIAVAQMLFSALLIHLSGGRIETHFHVFGSLAFLSFYRDWRVLVPATIVVAADHALRGMFWPESVFGVAGASGWRWVEHAGWVVFEDIFLVWACVRGAKEMAMLAMRQAELEATNERIEAEVARKTTRLESVTQELVNTARRAGMAEIATGVLHNVGNVLNSVNVSATVASRTVRESEIATLVKAGELLKSNQANLSGFLTNDERGKQLPEFFIELAECLGKEQSALISELTQMEAGLDHIKQIVNAQQQHAKNGTMRQRVAPADLFEQAIAMDSSVAGAGEIEFVRNFDRVAPTALDKHKVLQILINLLSNARRAVNQCGQPGKRITLSIRTLKRADENRLQFEVSDNGVGIGEEDLTRIFSHGFTTRVEGHGFGLHSAANEAREMGGGLTVASEGANRGATFTLDLPLIGLTEAEQLMNRKETQSCSQQ